MSNQFTILALFAFLVLVLVIVRTVVEVRQYIAKHKQRWYFKDVRHSIYLEAAVIGVAGAAVAVLLSYVTFYFAVAANLTS